MRFLQAVKLALWVRALGPRRLRPKSQKHRSSDFHLHHLSDQQVAIAQGGQAFANRGGGRVARGENHSADSLKSSWHRCDRSSFFFEAAMARSIKG
jgi:hypothetical protein